MQVDIEHRLGCIMQPTIQGNRQPICLQAIAKDIVVLLGKSHVLEILYLLKKSHSSIRFNELKRKISITSTTLSKIFIPDSYFYYDSISLFEGAAI